MNGYGLLAGLLYIILVGVVFVVLKVIKVVKNSRLNKRALEIEESFSQAQPGRPAIGEGIVQIQIMAYDDGTPRSLLVGEVIFSSLDLQEMAKEFLVVGAVYQHLGELPIKLFCAIQDTQGAVHEILTITSGGFLRKVDVKPIKSQEGKNRLVLHVYGRNYKDAWKTLGLPIEAIN